MVDLRQETQNVHDALWAHIDAGAFHRDIDKDSMCGLCAVASVALRDRLKRLGIEATLVLGYDTDTATVDPEDPDDEADCFHVWVLSEGQHLDPTYMQFGYDEPVWVGVRPPPRARATDWLRYHTVPVYWPESQHPDTYTNVIEEISCRWEVARPQGRRPCQMKPSQETSHAY